MSIFGRLRRLLGLGIRAQTAHDHLPSENGLISDEEAYIAALEAQRAEKDAFFKNHPHSPIPHHLREGFTGLAYYPPNLALRLLLPLEPDTSNEQIVMQTNRGKEQVYERLGYVSFEVEGRPTRLAIYRGIENGHLFLPFRDATSGRETYGAGRYLDPIRLDDGRFLIDFNLAYNPYCAYSDEWSCPLPPIENWLRVPIRAGEKMFPLADQKMTDADT